MASSAERCLLPAVHQRLVSCVVSGTAGVTTGKLVKKTHQCIVQVCLNVSVLLSLININVKT